MRRRPFFVLWTFEFIVVTCLYSSAEPHYNFSPDSPISYNFSIKGDITYRYEGISEEKFNVSVEGKITLKTIEKKENSFSVEVIPSSTVVKLDDVILEDITDSETAISHIISTSLIKIRTNGEIISIEELTPGILNISQMFMLLPVFPDKLKTPWKQTVPAFSIPGIPMCSLSFTYLYNREMDGISKIKLISNQPIKEERKEKDMTAVFTGRNNSKGEFIFDEDKGEIKVFEGSVDLLLNIVFKVPSSPQQKVSTRQSIPLRIGTKLDVKVKSQN